MERGVVGVRRSMWALLIAPALLWPHGARVSAAPARLLIVAPRAAVSIMPRQAHRARVTAVRSFAAGSGIDIQVVNLPRPGGTFCVGLASLIDRGGLPLNLGRLHARGARGGTLSTRIPAGLIGPEPAGPFLVFVGDCTSPAPMGNYGSKVISISR
ncbi:MAG: hypothetical protein NVSMB65_13170 [Chloroflexota bacterium]